MKTPRNIIIVDDNVRFRTDLKMYIEKELHHMVIAEASNGEDFLALHNLQRADVILMDIEMDRMDGFAATKEVLKNLYGLKIIAITMHSERMILRQLIEVGFRGCVFKSDIFKSLSTAINNVCKGHIYIPYKNMRIS